MDMRYYQGTGRRKTAVARVRLFPGGEGEILINGRTLDDYFGQRAIYRRKIWAPLQLTEMQDQLNVSIIVRGGGISGQAGAIRHGIARALLHMDESLRPPLKKAGFLTRDPRVKERKKPGLKRARKRPTYTKR
ncbi:MAG: 30S ribosomal protein S9 [Chloroflexia bacterium]|nr:30S ribosomal protein S9 [Chloroflexia bacterium]